MSAEIASQTHILVVDDEAAHMTALCHTLEDTGCQAVGFTSPAKALAALHDLDIDLVLTALLVPAGMGYAEASGLMKEMIEFSPDQFVLVFLVFALGFVVLTLPMGLLFTTMSRRLAVKR